MCLDVLHSTENWWVGKSIDIFTAPLFVLKEHWALAAAAYTEKQESYFILVFITTYSNILYISYSILYNPITIHSRGCYLSGSCPVIYTHIQLVIYHNLKIAVLNQYALSLPWSLPWSLLLDLQVQEKMGAMDNELRTAISKTVRKVRTLKAQFQEHKHKWQTVSWSNVKTGEKQERKEEGEVADKGGTA